AVDMALVLHQRGTGEMVEALDVVIDQMRVHAFEQREVLAQGDRHARRLQLEEERNEHAVFVREWCRDGKAGGLRRDGGKTVRPPSSSTQAAPSNPDRDLSGGALGPSNRFVMTGR